MIDAGRFVKSQVENVAGIFLVDEHVAPVVDAKSVEYEAQLLDTFGSAQLSRARLQARMEREMSLPYLAALENARLQLERRFQVAGLLLLVLTQVIQMAVAGPTPRRWSFHMGYFILMPYIVIGFRFQELIAKPRIVQILKEKSKVLDQLESEYEERKKCLTKYLEQHLLIYKLAQGRHTAQKVFMDLPPLEQLLWLSQFASTVEVRRNSFLLHLQN